MSVPSACSESGKVMCSSSGTGDPVASPLQTLTYGEPSGREPESMTNPVCAFTPPVEQSRAEG